MMRLSDTTKSAIINHLVYLLIVVILAGGVGWEYKENSYRHNVAESMLDDISKLNSSLQNYYNHYNNTMDMNLNSKGEHPIINPKGENPIIVNNNYGGKDFILLINSSGTY
jgi:hypothetical protein